MITETVLIGRTSALICVITVRSEEDALGVPLNADQRFKFNAKKMLSGFKWPMADEKGA